MVITILICFKKIDIKLNQGKLEFDKASGNNWFKYGFNEKNINIIPCNNIYFTLKMENEDYFMK